MPSRTRIRIDCLVLFVVSTLSGIVLPPTFGNAATRETTGKVFVTRGVPDDAVERKGVPGGVPGGVPSRKNDTDMFKDYKIEDHARGVVNPVLPTYPPAALQQGLEGKVYVEVWQSDGAVEEVKILKGPKILADAVRKAVGQWKYRNASSSRSGAYYTFHFVIAD